ncbi:hypothetical protein AZI86_13965 [Bdellovibrio bacteriovorus]|uniref:Uncharacterized protein n=1 Tax=Bdellovibrio bacteriovorus TaxID=959 RepID=A0A150WJM7_BDEBC|nr:hypothetical protein [Bdellovibrio bacteriovorus]KYG63916.1 hypothetical protein AZI86_13965 [Bdellovibrio bacteriovorus]
MKNILLVALILGTSFEASAYFVRKKETVEIQVNARVQYLGELRGFSQFHLDHVQLLQAPAEINKEALQAGLNHWLGARADYRLGYKACGGQAFLILKLDKRDLSPAGDVEYEAVADIELMQCKKK